MAGARRWGGLCEVQEIPEVGWALGCPGRQGGSLPSPRCQPAQPWFAGRPWQAPWHGRSCFGGSPGLRRALLHRGDWGWRGTLPGELLVTHQPLPWRGTGVSWGEPLGLAGGAALPRSSGAPESKARGWHQARRAGPGPAGLGQRGTGQGPLASSSPRCSGSRGQSAVLLMLSNYTSGTQRGLRVPGRSVQPVCVLGHRSGVGVGSLGSGPEGGSVEGGSSAGPCFLAGGWLSITLGCL